jgi:hypothetical protein
MQMNLRRGSVTQNHRKKVTVMETVKMGVCSRGPVTLCNEWTDDLTAYTGHQKHPGVKKAPTSNRSSKERNLITPMRSRFNPGKPTEGRQNSSVGVGRSKKRMPAAERQRESITGWIGLCPIRKDADVDMVNHPKNEVKVKNQGKS